MTIETPQIIWFCLVGINLITMAALDGKERSGNHSLAITMLGSGLQFWILYSGGFFG